MYLANNQLAYTKTNRAACKSTNNQDEGFRYLWIYAKKRSVLFKKLFEASFQIQRVTLPGVEILR